MPMQFHTRTRWLGTLHALRRSPHATLVDYNAVPDASPTGRTSRNTHFDETHAASGGEPSAANER
jgi:hypothetical protein